MKADSSVYVLDSFALLAYLQREAGGAQVEAVLEQAVRGAARVVMCIINYGEALYILERESDMREIQRTIAAVDALPVTMIDVGRDLVFAAAHIKANFALAYADAFAIALAQREHATILTGDPEFERVRELINIEWMER